MKQKILLTGASGLFGANFLNKVKTNNQLTIFSKRVDITHKNDIIKYIDQIKPDIILHAASLGSVDYCEKNKQKAWRTNVLGTRNIINGAKKAKSKLIFLSTNAVYDGKNPPYKESSRRKPIDYYGMTKVISENDIKKSGTPWVIVRLMTMYGWHLLGQRQNPVTWVIENLSQKKPIRVVTDLYNNHLYVNQAVESVVKIINTNRWKEVYNIAGQDVISRYQLAILVAEIFSLDKKLIQPVSSDFFNTLAPRAKNTSFNTDKMQKRLKIKSLSIKKGLMLMKKDGKIA